MDKLEVEVSIVSVVNGRICGDIETPGREVWFYIKTWTKIPNSRFLVIDVDKFLTLDCVIFYPVDYMIVDWRHRIVATKDAKERDVTLGEDVEDAICKAIESYRDN